MVPFESLRAVSYSPSIVTNWLSVAAFRRPISTNNILVESRHFFIPLAFDAPVRGFPSEYRPPVWCGKTRTVWLPDDRGVYPP